MITEKAFKKMNKMARRVAICRDALKQVAAQKFIPDRGTFMNFKGHDGYFMSEYNRNNSSGKKFIDEAAKCYVCAKGALVCSYVQNFNKKTVKEMRMIYNYDTVTEDYNDGSQNDMIKIFGKELWDQLEDEFEYEGVDLEDILRNVIKNKGVYIKSSGQIYGRND